MAPAMRTPRLATAVFASLCLALILQTAAAQPGTPTAVPVLGTPSVSAAPVPPTPTPPRPAPPPGPTASPAPAPPAPSVILPSTKPALVVNQVESSKFPQVVAYVTATDDTGTPVDGLTAANFELTEDNLPVPTFEVTTTVNTQEPLAVALLLDISGSMQGKSIEYARQAAANFLDVLGPRDSVELVSFSTYVKVNYPFTTTKPIIARGVENLRAGGDTALYDAIVSASNTLLQLGPGRKVAVLLTDGEDTSSKASLNDALAAAKRVPVFIVGLGNAIDRRVLDSIALQSGGSTIYAPSAIDLTRAYRTLADQLRGQYAITYGSSLKADGNEHKLQVRLKQASGTTDSQGTFVAQKNPPWLDIMTPGPGESITQTQEIQASALPGSPAAKITQVEFLIDDLLIGTASEPPYAATLSTVSTPAGEHTLKVIAYDSAGNTTSHEISFTVAKPTPTPQPTKQPTPTATPVPPPPPGSPFPTLPVAAGVSFLLVAGAVTGVTLNRRRQRGPYTCPHCGTVYAGRDSCPTCAVEDRRWLLRRLREVVGRGSSEEHPHDQQGGKKHG